MPSRRRRGNRGRRFDTPGTSRGSGSQHNYNLRSRDVRRTGQAGSSGSSSSGSGISVRIASASPSREGSVVTSTSRSRSPLGRQGEAADEPAREGTDLPEGKAHDSTQGGSSDKRPNADAQHTSQIIEAVQLVPRSEDAPSSTKERDADVSDSTIQKTQPHDSPSSQATTSNTVKQRSSEDTKDAQQAPVEERARIDVVDKSEGGSAPAEASGDGQNVTGEAKTDVRSEAKTLVEEIAATGERDQTEGGPPLARMSGDGQNETKGQDTSQTLEKIWRFINTHDEDFFWAALSDDDKSILTKQDLRILLNRIAEVAEKEKESVFAFLEVDCHPALKAPVQKLVEMMIESDN